MNHLIMIDNKLSEIMGRKRIRIADLRRKTGLSQNAILNLYHNKTKSVTYETMNKICWALEISVGELFEYIPDENS